ncbi:MAG TPA: DUF6379 domain-containing protein [Lapillicoccus sp.]
MLALREDALSTTARGFELRVGLPWIRSLPLSGVTDLRVGLDGEVVASTRILLGERRIEPAALVDERGWWHLQDRLVVTAEVDVTPGRHRVTVDFSILVPYLRSGPDTPLVIPLHLEADLETDQQVSPSVARDVA